MTIFMIIWHLSIWNSSFRNVSLPGDHPNRPPKHWQDRVHQELRVAAEQTQGLRDRALRRLQLLRHLCPAAKVPRTLERPKLREKEGHHIGREHGLGEEGGDFDAVQVLQSQLRPVLLQDRADPAQIEDRAGLGRGKQLHWQIHKPKLQSHHRTEVSSAVGTQLSDNRARHWIFGLRFGPTLRAVFYGREPQSKQYWGHIFLKILCWFDLCMSLFTFKICNYVFLNDPFVFCFQSNNCIMCYFK